MSTLEKLDSVETAPIETVAADWSTVSNHCGKQISDLESAF